MNITKEEIENYLTDIKNAIQNNQYRIERNSRRQDNLNLFVDYVIDEEKAKEIRQKKLQGIKHMRLVFMNSSGRGA